MLYFITTLCNSIAQNGAFFNAFLPLFRNFGRFFLGQNGSCFYMYQGERRAFPLSSLSGSFPGVSSRGRAAPGGRASASQAYSAPRGIVARGRERSERGGEHRQTDRTGRRAGSAFFRYALSFVGWSDPRRPGKPATKLPNYTEPGAPPERPEGEREGGRPTSRPTALNGAVAAVRPGTPFKVSASNGARKISPFRK